jgi:hypothetical protein
MSECAYWKGHDRTTDEKLALTLFRGQVTRGRATKRYRTKYLSHGSADEREALRALARLVGSKFSVLHREKNPIINDGILDLVCLALDPDWGAAHPESPRLIFEFPGPGNRSDMAADLQVAMHVATIMHDKEWPTEAAVKDAEKKFKLSRKAVFEAKRRVKQQFAEWGIEFPPD